MFPFEYLVGQLVKAQPQNYDTVRLLNSIVRNEVALDVYKVGKVVVFDSITNTVWFVFENSDVHYRLKNVVCIDVNHFRGQVSSPTKSIVLGMIIGTTCGITALVVNTILSKYIK